MKIQIEIIYFLHCRSKTINNCHHKLLSVIRYRNNSINLIAFLKYIRRTTSLFGLQIDNMTMLHILVCFFSFIGYKYFDILDTSPTCVGEVFKTVVSDT